MPGQIGIQDSLAAFSGAVRDHDGQGLAYDMVRLSDARFVTFLLAGLGQELKQQPKGHDKPE
jgi:hypothetical protein